MIEYIPKFSKLPKQFVVLEILWKRGTSSSAWTNALPSESVEVFPIFQERIYADLIRVQQKIQALRLIWDDETRMDASTKNIIVYIPSSLLKEAPETIEHVLFRFISYLYPFKGRKIIFTHEDEEKYPLFDNILSMINTVQHAKDLAIQPANIATPMIMAKQIQTMFRKHSSDGIHSTLLTKPHLEKKKMGLILAIGNSSKNPPCMLKLTRPKKKHTSTSKTICLIGKGVTFDSGGLSLKPIDGMYDMKYDKIGAVYMAHVFQLLANDEAFHHHTLVAILPFAENAISDKAIHPGDVVTGYSGTRVEIADPDAEGRLLLADAFAFAAEDKPDVLFDMATLTGHADSINCWHNGYAYCEPESLRFKFEKLTNKIGERMLTMPNWPEYRMALKSNIADLNNSPLDCSDAFTAALFLREFLPETVKTWVHIDLAHEFDDHIPKGNGIRTLHALAHSLFSE